MEVTPDLAQMTSAIVREWASFWASQVAPVIKNPPVDAGEIKRCGFDPWVGKVPWRRDWQPISVFLPREFHGQRSLEGYSP